MESATCWEYNSLTNELTQGREHAIQLGVHLSSTLLPQHQDLLQKILFSYEKSLLILKWNGPIEQPQPQPLAMPITPTPESSLSVDGSLHTDDFSKIIPAHNECYSNASKKRKAMPTWTEKVKINPHTGLEGPGDDGYSWRKYGQKDIQGTKHPRSYYRCTYRHSHNCRANKQVQRSDNDPSVFELTYKGTHTCILASQSAPPPATSPKKKELKLNYHHHFNNVSLQADQMLMHLKDNLRVKTDELEITKEERSPFSALPTFSSMTGENHECPFPALSVDDHHFLGTYTPSFMSSVSSESNYFSASSSQMNEYGNFHDFNHSETEQNGIFSANASSTNSPIAGLEYLMAPIALDSNFPFGTTGFSHDPSKIIVPFGTTGFFS